MVSLLEEGGPADRGDRCNVDDAPTTARHQMGPDHFARVEDKVELVPDAGVPIIDGQVLPWSHPGREALLYSTSIPP